MPEIKCPNCGKTFKVDESGYAAIVAQVRDVEFHKSVDERMQQLEKEKAKDLKIVESKAAMDKEQTVAELKGQIDTLKEKLAYSEKAKNNEIKLVETNAKIDKEKTVTELKTQIEALKAKVASNEKDIAIAVNEAVQKSSNTIAEKDKKIMELQNNLTNSEKDNQLKEESLKNQFAATIKEKDAEIAFYKDMKTKMSTKMVGETLEQHCNIEFERLRQTAFPNAYFEKDNDAKTGSKGDFIFKDYVDGIEYISIMFEMKNEMDKTATKHKNEDFFKELDKDRKEKGCEYAVLVSLLESDNELYNGGIVDVSHKYDKMYVVRPQCFIPIITLLRNAALNSVQYKRQVAEYRQANIDVSNFEQEMNEFKEKFKKNYLSAKNNFGTAIAGIDKTIKQLEAIKKALTVSENQLRLANEKAEDLTIKRLTKNNPTMAKAFEDLKKTDK